jgi:hypothetical protein
MQVSNEINCYYVDENYPQYLAGFIRINTSGALITMETENYQIDGKLSIKTFSLWRYRP